MGSESFKIFGFLISLLMMIKKICNNEFFDSVFQHHHNRICGFMSVDIICFYIFLVIFTVIAVTVNDSEIVMK